MINDIKNFFTTIFAVAVVAEIPVLISRFVNVSES